LLSVGAVIRVTATFTGRASATSPPATTTTSAAPSPGAALAGPAARAARSALTTLGAALQAPPLLVPPHGDERLLDDHDRVTRILRLVVGP
jgi:hypothetical protein